MKRIKKNVFLHSNFINDLCDKISNKNILSANNKHRELMAYILENYKSPDMTVQTVLDATQISNRQMAEIIHAEVGLSFVQYISYLRLNEFKRLMGLNGDIVRLMTISTDEKKGNK